MAVDPVLVDKKLITVKYTDWGKYIYYASFIASFGYRGAPTNDTNLRIRTIWADGRVIYFKDTALSTERRMPGLQFDFRLGTEDQVPFGAGTMAYRGQILIYFIRYNLGESANGLPAISAEFEDTDGTLTVADVMTTIAVRAGFDIGDIMIEGQLDQFDVVGYILNSQSTLETVATDLGYLYDFSMTEYAGTITFRHNYDDDGDLIITGTIPDGGLAVLSEGAADQQYDVVQRGSDNNQPLSLTATYYDYDLFYDPGSQTVNRNSGPLRTNNSTQTINLSLPIVAHGDEIKARLLAALYRQWEGKNGHSLRLPPAYLYMDAGDIAAWTAYGNNYTGQLVKVTLNADWSQSVSVNERSAVYNTLTVPTETPSAPDVVVAYNEAMGLLLDIPDTDEGQATDGFLNLRLAVGPAVAGETFYGARLDMTTVDQPTNWGPVKVIDTPCLIAPLSSPPATDATEITIDLGVMTIERLDAAVPGDLIVFGTPGFYEICTFEGYVDNGDDTATISLTRGLFGTDDLINTHTAAGNFVFYDDTVNVTYRVEAYRDYTQYLWRILASFQPVETAGSSLWVPQGNSRKPYSPNSIAVARDLAGDITITWAEDVRFSGEPLPKAYSIDIYSIDGSTVLRRFQNITTTIQTYFIEEQVNDGFDGTEPALFVVVYQVNLSHVGRGFPSGGLQVIDAEGILEATVTLELTAAATIDQEILLEANAVLDLTADANLTTAFEYILKANALLEMEATGSLSVSYDFAPLLMSYSIGEEVAPLFDRMDIDKPAGTVEGDLLVFAAFISTVTAASTWPARDVDTLKNSDGSDAGFSTLQAQKLGSGTARPKAMLSWKIAGPSEPATYEWAEWSTSEVNGRKRGILMRFTNFDEDNPILSNGYQGSATNTRLHTAPSVTGEVNGLLFNTVFPKIQVWSESAVDYTKPADMDWVYLEPDGTTTSNLMAVADKLLTTAGATGAKTYTPPVSVDPLNTNSVPYVGFSFVVNARPAFSANAVLDLTATAELVPDLGLMANALLELNAEATLANPRKRLLVQMSADIADTTTAVTEINFTSNLNSVVYDVGGWVSGGSFVVPAGVTKIAVLMSVQVDGNTNVEGLYARFKINGNQVLGSTGQTSRQSTSGFQNNHAIVRMAPIDVSPGDVITAFWGKNDSFGVAPIATSYTFLAVEQIP